MASRLSKVMLVLAALLVATAAYAQGQPPPEFVPVGEAPQAEQIPAMPLLGIAYGFIWVGMFAYVWSIGRRLQKVEGELSALESRKS